MLNLLTNKLATLSKLLNVIFDLIKSRILIYPRVGACGNKLLISKPESLVGLRYAQIGNSLNIKRGARLEVFDFHNSVEFSPRLIIGNNVSINYNFHLGVINRVEIGTGCLIGSDVTITDHSHGDSSSTSLKSSPSERKLISPGPVVLGDNVWVGSKVTILPGVEVGRNSIIGAGTVVTKSVPPFSVVVGNPGKVIKIAN